MTCLAVKKKLQGMPKAKTNTGKKAIIRNKFVYDIDIGIIKQGI